MRLLHGFPKTPLVPESSELYGKYQSNLADTYSQGQCELKIIRITRNRLIIGPQLLCHRNG